MGVTEDTSPLGSLHKRPSIPNPIRARLEKDQPRPQGQRGGEGGGTGEKEYNTARHPPSRPGRHKDGDAGSYQDAGYLERTRTKPRTGRERLRFSQRSQGLA